MTARATDTPPSGLTPEQAARLAEHEARLRAYVAAQHAKGLCWSWRDRAWVPVAQGSASAAAGAARGAD